MLFYHYCDTKLLLKTKEKIPWQNVCRSRCFCNVKLENTKTGNKANKNCILALHSLFLSAEKVFFSFPFHCLMHCHTQNGRYSEINSHEQWELSKKEMDTERERETSKLDTIETTFMNCLSEENNEGFCLRERLYPKRYLAVCYVVHS